MPHIAKGGKYVIGWSVIRGTCNIKVPETTYNEYNLANEEYVNLISGSKTCVLRTENFCQGQWQSEDLLLKQLTNMKELLNNSVYQKSKPLKI
jgi:hypothetical protein